jgi:hypothetical protein
VQFLPPTSASSLPAITATYSGDATHKSSSGQTHYGPASELASHVELSELGTIRPDGTVEIPVGCGFPCLLSGELPGQSGLSASLSSTTFAVKHGKSKKKKKKKHKPAPLGKGTLKLNKAGKGTLVIKLSSKAKHALGHVKAKGVRVTVKLTIRTASGTLVATETKHVKLRPQKKKAHVKHH